jgi:CRP/FNR family transcriptional regulator, cyclic AMP receptor protein
MALRKNAKLDLLRTIPLFAPCSKRDLDHISRISHEVEVAADAVLIEEGTPGTTFFVVVEGVLAVVRNGRRRATIGEGDYVGEMALLSNSPRNATVKALTPSRLLVIDDEAFLDLLDRAPYLWHKIAAGLADRIPDDELFRRPAEA